MTNPVSRSKILQAGVMTIGILAAMSFSSQALAWGNRGAGGYSGGGFAARSEGGAAKSQTAEQRKAALQAKFKGKGLKKEGGQGTAAVASANAQVPAQAPAVGWRQKLQAQSTAGKTGQRSGGWSRANGQTGTRSGTYTTTGGGSGTFTQDYARGDGTSTRDSTITNANGDTKGWTTQQSVTHSDGVVSASTTVTGDNGKTRSSGTTLDANTNTLTHTETGANGQTHGVTLQGDGTPGDGDRTGTYTTQSGQTGAYNQQVSASNGTVTRQNTVTNSNGQTAGWTTQQSASVNNGTLTTGTNVTGQNGKTESWETTYNKSAGTLEHTYTAPNGHTYGGTATFNQ